MRAFEFLIEQEIDQDPGQIRSDQRMQYIVDTLKSDTDALSRVYKMLKSLEDQQEGAGTSFKDYLDQKKTAPETDQGSPTSSIFKKFIKALNDADGDYDDLKSFLETYGQIDYIDTKQLMSAGKQPVTNWLKGQGKVSDGFIQSLWDNLFGIGHGGPSESAMRLLSPSVTGAPRDKGDLMINGLPVEVKGETTKGGGRLGGEKTSIGAPNLNQPEIYGDERVPQELQVPYTAIAGNPGRGSKTKILDHALALDKIDPQIADNFMREMVTATWYKAADSYDELFQNWRGMDHQAMFNTLATMNFRNYVKELSDKETQFKHLLFITPKSSLFFDVKDFAKNRDQFKLQSIDFGDSNYGALAQVSLN